MNKFNAQALPVGGPRMSRGGTGRGLVGLIRTVIAGALLIGCGSGKLGLTGGSIPIGTAALRGAVIRGDDTTRAVQGATVSLQSGTLHSDAVSDSTGNFNLANIAGGSFTCTVKPSDNSDLTKNWSWNFTLPNGSVAQLYVALWPARFDTNTVGRVTLTPNQYTLRAGDSIRLVAETLDKSGNALNVSPSLLLTGDSITLLENGGVRGEHAGTAYVTAWLDGKFSTTTITVIP